MASDAPHGRRANLSPAGEVCVIDFSARRAMKDPAVRHERLLYEAGEMERADDLWFRDRPGRVHMIRAASPAEIELYAKDRAPRSGEYWRMAVRDTGNVRASILLQVDPKNSRLEPHRRGEAASARVWNRLCRDADFAWRRGVALADGVAKRFGMLGPHGSHDGLIFPTNQPGEPYALEFYGDSGGFHEFSGSLSEVLERAVQVICDPLSSGFDASLRVRASPACLKWSNETKKARHR